MSCIDFHAAGQRDLELLAAQRANNANNNETEESSKTAATVLKVVAVVAAIFLTMLCATSLSPDLALATIAIIWGVTLAVALGADKISCVFTSIGNWPIWHRRTYTRRGPTRPVVVVDNTPRRTHVPASPMRRIPDRNVSSSTTTTRTTTGAPPPTYSDSWGNVPPGGGHDYSQPAGQNVGFGAGHDTSATPAGQNVHFGAGSSAYAPAAGTNTAFGAGRDHSATAVGDQVPFGSAT